MTARTLFPRLLVIGSSLFLTASIAAQSNTGANNAANNGANHQAINPASNPDDRPRYALTNEDIVKPKAEPAKQTKIVAERLSVNAPKMSALERQFVTQMLSSIESHLGAPYRYNRTGPDSFDCSGLVWRAFNDIGVNFQRGPARSYWATFAAPAESEQFKFGNLVFFSGLTHVGIVADEKGFYHSSRRNGVIYSTFSDYWLSRIDGFRRVPLQGMQTIASEKNRQPKSSTSVSMSDEGTPR